MSGAALLIAGISAGVGALGVGVSAIDGAKSADAEKKALAQQTTATQTAEANALSTQRANQTATNAANQQTPNIAAIMNQAAQISKVGAGSTMLTGTGGVGNGSLSLGKSSLLGS
jgi:ABC-type lipoprotein release transport system permease subunit